MDTNQDTIHLLENQINEIVKNTQDPLTKLYFHEFSFETQLSVYANILQLKILAGFPCQITQTTLIPEIKKVLHQHFPHYSIEITLESFIQSHQTQMLGKSIRGVKNTIAIASGKGGVGKSTVTVNIARALAKAGARVGILDADIYGPSIPTMLGEVAPIEIEGEHYLPAVLHGIQAMSIGYLSPADSPLIWRGPMLAKALIQMLDITKWDNLDYLFIDLPPGTGDVQLSLVQKIPLTGAIIVTTPQSVATLDAEKALKMFLTTHIDVLGVVENMSYHICSQCKHNETIFGSGGAAKLCSTYSTRLLGQLPFEKLIVSESDNGRPIIDNKNAESATSFQKAALMASIEIAKRPINYATKFPPIIVE